MPLTRRQENVRTVLALLATLFLLAVMTRLLQSGYNLGSLPGDTYLDFNGFSAYLPITSIALVSLIFNLTAYLIYRLMRRRLR